jgi:S-adenosylmethionine:tRNA ribosyltransferase-isomerase
VHGRTWGSNGPGVETNLFSFDLPEDLIAQEPVRDRESARLLVLDRSTGRTKDLHVRDLPRIVPPGTLVVLNDTRVRKARLFAEGLSGKKVEVLLLARRGPSAWEALGGGRLRAGRTLGFADGVSGTIESAEGEIRVIRFEPPIDDAWLEKNGHVPLPPYVKRADTPADQERYQTVYSRIMGSAAAPTAGLHFTESLLRELTANGVQTAWITLHVGLGTFLPIRADQIEGHTMHWEKYAIPPRTKDLVDAAVRDGAPVLAVGTTVVRTLEAAWADGLTAGEGRTSIYITPGFRFRVVSRLLTNFHTPRSSLLVLVSAFAGREQILRAYEQAIQKKYRFFSYGDAMLIE